MGLCSSNATLTKLATFDGASGTTFKAPGFAKVSTTGWNNKFPDISSYSSGFMQLRVRSTTSNFGGFRLAFAAKGVPHTSIFGGGSFKAGFNLTSKVDFQLVK